MRKIIWIYPRGLDKDERTYQIRKLEQINPYTLCNYAPSEAMILYQNWINEKFRGDVGTRNENNHTNPADFQKYERSHRHNHDRKMINK